MLVQEKGNYKIFIVKVDCNENYAFLEESLMCDILVTITSKT